MLSTHNKLFTWVLSMTCYLNENNVLERCYFIVENKDCVTLMSVISKKINVDTNIL